MAILKSKVFNGCSILTRRKQIILIRWNIFGAIFDLTGFVDLVYRCANKHDPTS